MLAFAGLLLAVASPPAAEPEAALRAEAARLRTLLAGYAADDEERPSVQAPLDKADAALARGRFLLAATRLREAGQNAEGRAYVARHAAVRDAGLPAFEAEWTRLGAEIAATRRELPLDAGAGRPAAVRALVEASLATVDPLYQSGRLYAQNTTVEYGLYYLGMGRSALDWARLLTSTQWPAPAPQRFSSPDAALEALDMEILDTYARAKTTEARQAFIPSNTALKRARDLRREARLFGTWLELLNTRRALGLARRVAGLQPEPSAADRDRLAALLHERQAGWPGGIDHSLGRLFAEEAETALEDGDLRRVAAIVEDLLPAYAEAVAGAPASLEELRAPAPGAVTVTLVRWPYT